MCCDVVVQIQLYSSTAALKWTRKQENVLSKQVVGVHVHTYSKVRCVGIIGWWVVKPYKMRGGGGHDPPKNWVGWGEWVGCVLAHSESSSCFMNYTIVSYTAMYQTVCIAAW